MLTLGRINPKPKIVSEKKSIATIDGDNGLGLVVGPKANNIAMDKAEQFGSGWVSVCNTNHYGIASYYTLKALERDMIGWSMTNTTKLVAPIWGAERMLGTNPIAISFPGFKEKPSSLIWPPVLQIDGFMDKTEFKKMIDEWIHVFRNTKPAPGIQGVLIPGDPEHEQEELRTKNGIPVIQAVVETCSIF